MGMRFVNVWPQHGHIHGVDSLQGSTRVYTRYPDTQRVRSTSVCLWSKVAREIQAVCPTDITFWTKVTSGNAKSGARIAHVVCVTAGEAMAVMDNIKQNMVVKVPLHIQLCTLFQALT